LYVRIFVKPHAVFERKGDDLFIQVPISFSQASLGDEISILTLDKKKIIIKIPAGIESGKILRITNQGIPHFGSRGRGNLYAELVIKTPKKLTKKQKELLKKLKEEGI
jgi:molecular chaperone DnaJ